MVNEVYYPEQIDSKALPIEGSQTVYASNSGGTSKEIYSPSTTVIQKFPEKVIARETISSAFNTQTKKIKGEFTFGKQGAISIGDYQFGVSGDIRFTPNGIVARNLNGETTVGIDGATGDATYKGILQAGTLIGGDNKVVIDEVDGNGRIVMYDDDDLPSIVMGALN